MALSGSNLLTMNRVKDLNENDIRSKIQDLLDDAVVLITLNSTDDNYRTLAPLQACRILRIIRDKLVDATALGEEYVKRHPHFPSL